MDISVSGAVIRETAVGESDKLITVLTPEYGKITIKAKGVKNIKSKNAAATQLFCYSDFELTQKGGRYTLKTAYVKQSFYGMRNDVLRYSLACYIVDTINAVTTEQNDEAQVLRLLLNTLYALSEKSDIPLWKIKGAYELKLMELCGFMPELNECCGCGCDTDSLSSLFISFIDSLVVCKNCKTSGYSGGALFSLSKEVLWAMKSVFSLPLQKFLSFECDESYKEEFSFICENYLINQTERTYDTLRIYKSMTNTFNTK